MFRNASFGGAHASGVWFAASPANFVTPFAELNGVWMVSTKSAARRRPAARETRALPNAICIAAIFGRRCHIRHARTIILFAKIVRALTFAKMWPSTERKESGIKEAGMFRLFVAISLPDAVKDEIEKAQGQIRGALREDFIRWAKPEQFHLTLKFLGNVAPSRVAELTEALRAACVNFSALQLRAERIGFFPNMRFPRVVWASVHDGKDILPRLQEAIATNIGGFVEKQEGKKFTGHITLGRMERINRPQSELLTKLAYGMGERFFGEWTANKVELIRSELSSSGSRYTTVAAIPLSGPL
jgi:RNA 2',3'-cyclic 3'-phosphodiesterase